MMALELARPCIDEDTLDTGYVLRTMALIPSWKVALKIFLSLNLLLNIAKESMRGQTPTLMEA